MERPQLLKKPQRGLAQEDGPQNARSFSREIGIGTFLWVRQAFMHSGGLGSNPLGLKWWLKAVIPPLSLSRG